MKLFIKQYLSLQASDEILKQISVMEVKGHIRFVLKWPLKWTSMYSLLQLSDRRIYNKLFTPLTCRIRNLKTESN